MRRQSLLGIAVLAFVVLLGAAPTAAADPLRVVVSVPDLAELVREVGGDDVALTVLTRGPQDPHAVEPRPSFIRALHRAELFALAGMELEVGWAPVLLGGARNPALLPGASGYLDASLAIEPLQVPGRGADRSQGDLHPYGNPHYLADPLNALRVSALIRDRLAALRPEGTVRFAERRAHFARRLVEALVGPALVAHHDPLQLARRVEAGGLDAFLDERHERELLGGWLGAMQPYAGTPAVEEHQFWAYFARRFGLRLLTTLEPFPGIAPTTRHLAHVVERMRSEQARIILSNAYFDAGHARWVAERTGARVVPMAHQPGARPGTDDYLATVDHNVRALVEALGGS